MEPTKPGADGSTIATTAVELKNTAAIEMQSFEKDTASGVEHTENVKTDDTDPTGALASPTIEAAIFNNMADENGLSVTAEVNDTERQVSYHCYPLLLHIFGVP